jgi:uncharacterized protein YlaN (UPF0358 family)
MNTRLLLLVLSISLFAGCASVPMQTKEESLKAKEFTLPEEGFSGLYLYRSAGLGAALKKDIWVNGKCIGETAPQMFFYEKVKSDEEYKISTESEFSPNELVIKPESGKNYFIEQYMKMGVFVGGAGLELVSEEDGKKEISKLELAKTGSCSQ